MPFEIYLRTVIQIKHTNQNGIYVKWYNRDNNDREIIVRYEENLEMGARVKTKTINTVQILSLLNKITFGFVGRLEYIIK